MAEYNRVKIGDKADYQISAITELDDNRGYLLSFKKDGRSLLSRMFVSVGDIENYHVGDTLKLVPWTMDIIAIQKKRDDGSIRTYRNLQGLAWDETDARGASQRSMQNMYDTADFIDKSKETVAIARADRLFANFVDRETFMKMMNDGVE